MLESAQAKVSPSNWPETVRYARLPKKSSASLRGLVVRQGRHAEHLARALAIAGGDDGRVDVDEIPLVEKPVDREGHAAADAEHRAVEIGARPQMGDAAQELLAVAFLLQRIILRHAA